MVVKNRESSMVVGEAVGESVLFFSFLKLWLIKSMLLEAFRSIAGY